MAELAPTFKKPAPHFWRYALWPISVWMSFRQFDAHAADDYVEMTSPIMAAAVCFWLCVAWIVGVLGLGGSFGDLQLLIAAAPLIYLVGLLLYINRERNFAKS